MILVAIGANLPGSAGAPLDACRAAADALASLPGFAVEAVSPWYRTAADPPGAGPPFVNGVARLARRPGGEAVGDFPAALLASLHAIEERFGRVRSTPNAPRTLDLDVVAFDGLVRAAPDPVLPHPRAHLRAFVLLPLRDVAPSWRHPASGIAVDDLIAALGAAAGGPRRLAQAPTAR